MIVIFIYTRRLVSSEKFLSPKPGLTSLSVFLYFMIFQTPSKLSHGGGPFISIESNDHLFSTLFNIYGYENLIFLTLLILLTILIVVKMVQIFKGPLK
jgi:hypothetical protein